jgi:hypothetical protein
MAMMMGTITSSAYADEASPGATQYALVAIVTLCALLTLVTFILWRKQPDADGDRQ